MPTDSANSAPHPLVPRLVMDEAGGLLPTPRLVTDEEREATMAAQLRAAASAKIIASLHPGRVEQRACCQAALRARPAPPDAAALAATGTAEALAAAIRGHRRYGCSGVLSLLGKSRTELALILANLEPQRRPTRELAAVSSERFLRTARLVERRAEIERLQAARAAEGAARAAAAAAAAEAAAAKALAAAKPRNFWEQQPRRGAAGGGGGGGEEDGILVREKSAEQLQRERDAHVKRYWKLTDKEALAWAKSRYASHKF
jgi:hypothetical protein